MSAVADLRHLTQADTNHAVEIAPRVWWVGHVLPDDVFQCHAYLIEQDDQSVLVDPGSPLTFSSTFGKIEEVIPFSNIRYFICHHSDPDIAAALPTIDKMVDRPDAVVVTHWRTQALLKHYGLGLSYWLVEQHDWRLQLLDRELRFVFTPYAHFPGAICTFDAATGTLFSSDLFGGFTVQPSLVATDESYFEALRPFHEHYIPSRDILDFALSQIARHPVKTIAPQHGSIVPEILVSFMMEKLRNLDCGIYLSARDDTDIVRLSRLNRTLRDITQTMLLYRDFRDIADRLLKLVQRHLPVARIDYFALLEGNRILSLSQDNRFFGTGDDVHPEVQRILGRTRYEWFQAHILNDNPADHVLCEDAFCACRHSDGGQTLTVPLFSPRSQRVEGAALIHLVSAAPITPQEAQVVRQLGTPLEVALEREVVYRTIEAERQTAYQRSIRDSLTGLFNRAFMQEVAERHCSPKASENTPAVAAVMLDIDRFKQVNDTYGHGVGDEVLKSVSRAIREDLRESDIPVRFGGEELIVFLVGTSAKGASRYAERVRSKIGSQPVKVDGGLLVPITVSLGVAMHASGEPFDSLVRRADEALYRAKQNGRDCVEIATPPIGASAG